MTKWRASKAAVNPERFRAPLLVYGSARAGMLDLLTSGALPQGQRVLLPAYIGVSQNEGSGVIDPVFEAGMMPGFYRLHSDLRIDLDDLSEQLKSGDVAVIVVIHYFGRTEPRLRDVRRLADEHGAILVEDLAHGLYTALGRGEAGEIGDVSLFSLHKMLPVPEGGAVRYRTTSLLDLQRSDRPDLYQALTSFDLAAIARHRQENVRSVTRALLEHPLYGKRFELLWPEIEDHDVLQSVPVRVMGGGRDAAYAAMNSDGWGMVSLWHTLIPELRDDYPEMWALSRAITNFPVHQDVHASDAGAMVEAFSRALTEGGAT